MRARRHDTANAESALLSRRWDYAMLPSLSDKTKSYTAVFAVLAVALCNVVFGMDWVSAPAPRRPAPIAGVSGDTAVVPIPPVEVVSPAPAPPAQPAHANTAAPPKEAPPAQASAPMPEPIAPAATAPAEPAQPPCDVTACAAAYHSFRASDCTWQPYEGPRRLCTKGAAASAEPAAGDARTDTEAGNYARCNRRACAEHYSSFNPSDCTYQPLDGPRRLCTK
jgi:BA14K-like protein